MGVGCRLQASTTMSSQTSSSVNIPIRNSSKPQEEEEISDESLLKLPKGDDFYGKSPNAKSFMEALEHNSSTFSKSPNAKAMMEALDKIDDMQGVELETDEDFEFKHAG